MDKKGAGAFWVSIILVVLLIVVIFLYFALFNFDNNGVYTGKVIANPVLGLSNEQAVADFNEDSVFYLLYNMRAYNLRNPPLSSDYPRIKLEIDEEIFSANVREGLISVSRKRIFGEDIAIKTTKEEAVKMIRDRDYILQSFGDGKSAIEFVADKTTLFAKGYLNFYNNLMGRSITGNLIRIATD